MRKTLIAALAAFAALPVYADETEGLVQAYDRVAGVLVLTDKTVWALPAGVTVPDDFGRGDRVLIDYETAGEDGLVSIDKLTRLAVALPEGTDGGS
ncbi:MAG: hypothetical protein HKN27_05280 [Silicimonas sp.]|nr:hypothetical protein [Silicimonas sp.]